MEEFIDLSGKFSGEKLHYSMKFNSAIVPDDGNQRWLPELKKYVKFTENTEISVCLRQKEISHAEISVYQDCYSSMILLNRKLVVLYFPL